MTFRSITLLATTLLVLLAGCAKEEGQTRKEGVDPPPTPPVVKEGSPKILFSWFDNGEPKTTTDLNEVPDDARNEVRVQDLEVPPERRDPAWIFLADLTSKNKAGGFKVRAVRRSEYERARHPEVEAQEKAGGGVQETAGDATVIMYTTPHCPHCKRARKWLLDNQIPYKELDVSEDANAQARLDALGKSQGVSTSGVPMFEINGMLIPGFAPEAILKALKETPDSPAPSGKGPDTLVI